jgi:hypothetical protein
MVVLVFFFGIGIFAIMSISHNPWNFWNLRLLVIEPIWIVSQIALFIYFVLINSLYKKKSFQTRNNIGFGELVLSFGGLAILISLSGIVTINIYLFMLYTFLFGIFGRRLFFYISSVIDSLLNFLFSIFGYDKIPESIVAHNILMILDAIEQHPELLSNLNSKRMLITRLDYIATAINTDVPNLLKTKNVDFNNSAKLISQEIANSIKDKKFWVLTPKDDTSQYLANYLSDFLFHFVNGDWDSLKRVNAPEITLTERWTKRYLPILKPIFLLGLPLVAYFWLQNSIFSSEPWMGTVTGYLIVWVIINFVSLLDPSAKEKIGALTDTAGMF